jgi:hypothetical protein
MGETMPKEEKRILALDKYEHGVVINALNDMRKELLRNSAQPNTIDDLLIKTIDAPNAARLKYMTKRGFVL